MADASVWIDFLRDRFTPQVDRLQGLFESDRLAVADLTVTEVLQGIGREKNLHTAERLLGRLPLIKIADWDVAIAAARNYRLLRARGITVRGTIDSLIATRCIQDNYALLFSDRDFDPFVEHLGLTSAMAV